MVEINRKTGKYLLSKKIEEFSSCYCKLVIIHNKSNGLPEEFHKIKNNSLLAMFYFTQFVHERQGTNRDFQKFHRIAIRKSLNRKNFESELKNKKSGFPNHVWSKFKKLTRGRPNEKMTKGPVFEILKKMQREGEPNIIKLLANKDCTGAQKFLKSIKGIGNKISALILRDFQHFLKLWDVPNGEYFRFQPVDIWVMRMSKLCWPKEQWVDAKHDENAKIIVKCCKKESINPLSFNQGAWFVGSHYTDLCRFNKISEDDSVDWKKCIMKFSLKKVLTGIEKFENLGGRRKFFPI